MSHTSKSGLGDLLLIVDEKTDPRAAETNFGAEGVVAAARGMTVSQSECSRIAQIRSLCDFLPNRHRMGLT